MLGTVELFRITGSEFRAGEAKTTSTWQKRPDEKLEMSSNGNTRESL